jgi:hypothetical protein
MTEVYIILMRWYLAYVTAGATAHYSGGDTVLANAWLIHECGGTGSFIRACPSGQSGKKTKPISDCVNDTCCATCQSFEWKAVSCFQLLAGGHVGERQRGALANAFEGQTFEIQ